MNECELCGGLADRKVNGSWICSDCIEEMKQKTKAEKGYKDKKFREVYDYDRYKGRKDRQK